MIQKKSDIDKLISPVLLTEEIVQTQFQNKIDRYNKLDYTKSPCKQEDFKRNHKRLI